MELIKNIEGVARWTKRWTNDLALRRKYAAPLIKYTYYWEVNIIGGSEWVSEWMKLKSVGAESLYVLYEAVGDTFIELL